MKDFDDVWLQVVADLRTDDVIKNWGSAQGYTGGTFKIDQVTDFIVAVSGGNMADSRPVSKGDLQKVYEVYEVWEQYVAGNYSRSKMASLSQNTTYILSLFRRIIGA